MPFAHVHLRSGRTVEQKKSILDGLHAALVEAFRIPESDRNQVVHEYPPEDFEARHGGEAVFVEISVFPGRSAETKRLLYRAIVRNLEERARIPRDRVVILLHEPPLENWGIRGGQAASDVAIGFELDV